MLLGVSNRQVSGMVTENIELRGNSVETLNPRIICTHQGYKLLACLKEGEDIILLIQLHDEITPLRIHRHTIAFADHLRFNRHSLSKSLRP